MAVERLGRVQALLGPDNLGDAQHRRQDGGERQIDALLFEAGERASESRCRVVALERGPGAIAQTLKSRRYNRN